MAELDERSRVWVIRHGETEWSRLGKHTGREDVPLTVEGEAAARALADRLAGRHFDRVLTSPRTRARRTAELAGFPDAAVVDDLVEWDYGKDEGLTTAEIREDRPGWTVWSMGPRSGETVEEVGARADRVLSRIAAELAADGGDIVLVGHAHFLRMVTARRLGLPPAAGALFRLDTATVSRLGTEHDRPAVVAWNVGPQALGS